MTLTDEDVGNLVGMSIASFPDSTMSREGIIRHLDAPVCEIMSGVRIHLQAIGLLRMWQLCYALRCCGPETLTALMWKMIKMRKRKDSTWQNYLPG